MTPFIRPTLFLLLATVHWAKGGCCALANDQAVFAAHTHVAEVIVNSSRALRAADGMIHTRYELATGEKFKGQLPATLVLDTPGGILDGEEYRASNSLVLKPGKTYVLHLIPPTDGDLWTAHPFSVPEIRGTASDTTAVRNYFRSGATRLKPRPLAMEGSSVQTDSSPSGVPGSVVTATGYSESGGLPSRFIECDGGTAIPYLVDIDPAKLPAGMSAAAALQKVSDVLNVWAAASSLRFRFAGQVSFGSAADSINVRDGVLRIQLHDNFNSIGPTTTLGIGGGTSTLGDVNQHKGAVVAGQPFQRRLNAYIVLNHRASLMQSQLPFAEVMTHEIGHALGLTHSSENIDEPDAILENATMYYRANDDGRGAAITIYDEDRINFGYPQANTPPFSMERLLRVVTGSPQPTGPGVDRITVTASDLQTPAAVTVSLVAGTNEELYGLFTLSGNSLIYTPAGLYGDSSLTPQEIVDGYYYDRIGFQISDGVNLSPVHFFTISGFHYDAQTSDGLPNSWLQTYFANGAPGAVGTTRHPDSDPDLDGVSNRIERYLDTNPNDPLSGPAKLVFDASTRSITVQTSRFAPYALESSVNLPSWTRRRLFTRYSTDPAVFLTFPEDAAAPSGFYRATVTP